MSTPRARHGVGHDCLAITAITTTMVIVTLPICTSSPLTAVGTLDSFIFDTVGTVNTVLLNFNVIRVNLTLGDRSTKRHTRNFVAFFKNMIVCFTGSVLSVVLWGALYDAYVC